MNKNLIPIIVVLAVVVLGGAAYWLSPKAPAAPEPGPLDVAPVPSLGTSSDPSAPGMPGVAGAGGNAAANNKTIWRDITADDWSIVFKVQTKWKASPIYGANGKLSQVSIGGDTETFFVSKNSKIAESSKLAYTTKTMTIAGKSVPVHVYESPSAGNAFYWYFALPAGTDTYYFRAESAVASTKIASDFINFIEIK